MAKNIQNCDIVVLGAGDASGGWTIYRPMPAISAGNWMVSSGYWPALPRQTTLVRHNLTIPGRRWPLEPPLPDRTARTGQASRL